ncbi:MAG: tetratricopeptide repeat protein [Candidatus Eisenbacteria bacterium]|nr:tetratricopeptide repeat protein [Candidatus Eisenbacteria bacterium]
MKRQIVALGILLSCTFFLVLGCGGKKGIRPESALDTPEAHYKTGMAYVEKGEYEKAAMEFERALGLAKSAKKDFAPGHEGLALVHLGKGEIELARSEANKAKGIDGNYAPAYIALGRIETADGKFEKALGEFDTAAKKDPRNADCPYYRAKTLVSMKRYDEAELSYKKALELNPNHAKANADWADLQRARRAMAGMPPEYEAIAKTPAITRADLAALLMMELKVDKLMKPTANRPQPTFRPPGSDTSAAALNRTASDVSGSWAKPYIDKTVALGVMDLFPDGTFVPRDIVSRANYALTVQRILAAVIGEQGLTTRFIGTVSPFPDVPSSNYAFNAIMVVTTRGIMKAKMDGTFGMTDPVPGADALLMLRALKEQLP